MTRHLLAIYLCWLAACGGLIEPSTDGGKPEDTSQDAGLFYDVLAAGDSPAATDASLVRDASPDVGEVADAAAVADVALMDVTSVIEASFDDVALPTLVCEAGQPVAVCVQFFALMLACTGQGSLYDACQASLIPTSAADLQQIEALCSANLQREKQNCK